MSWLKNQKYCLKESSSLILHHHNKSFFIILWCVTESGFYTTSSVVGPRSSKALPKAKLAPKKVMVNVWWSAATLIHDSFLNPGETVTFEKYAQQINEMHWKLQCPQPTLVNRTGPTLLHNNIWSHILQATLQKLNELGLWSFASSTIFTWLLVNWLPRPSSISTSFCRENASTARRRQKMLSKSQSNPKAQIFMLWE